MWPLQISEQQLLGQFAQIVVITRVGFAESMQVRKCHYSALLRL